MAYFLHRQNCSSAFGRTDLNVRRQEISIVDGGHGEVGGHNTGQLPVPLVQELDRHRQGQLHHQTLRAVLLKWQYNIESKSFDILSDWQNGAIDWVNKIVISPMVTRNEAAAATFTKYLLKVELGDDDIIMAVFDGNKVINNV
jgi:hypothetical protein